MLVFWALVMSESLVPFIRGGEGRRPVIVVDSREASAAPKVLKGLREADVDIRIVALPRGDYIISDRVAIERKTVKDFVYTLTRRHLFEQIFTLKELADFLGVTEPTVKGYAKHERGRQKLELMKKGFAVEKLGLSYSDLFFAHQIIELFKESGVPRQVDILKFKTCLDELNECKRELGTVKKTIQDLVCSK